MAKKLHQLKPEVSKIVREYYRHLLDAEIPIKALIVFGSQARGTANASSDIDIAVVSPIFGKDYFDEMVMLRHLRKGLYEIEPHPMHPNDLNAKWSTFTNEVKKYGIPV